MRWMGLDVGSKTVGVFLGIYESDKKEGLVKPHMLFFGETNDGID